MVAQLVGKLEPLAGRLRSSSGSPEDSLKAHQAVFRNTQDSAADEDSYLDSCSEASDGVKGAGGSSGPREIVKKTARNSIFDEYKSLFDVAQDTHAKVVSCGRRFVVGSQYKGPQLGFSILLSEQSINYVKLKLAPKDHYLVVPMQTMPVYMIASKKAFHSIWLEPQVQTTDSIASLRMGCFPDAQFIDEVLCIFEKIHFANFICSVEYVRGLFEVFHSNKKARSPDPKVLSYSELMIMSLVMIICVSAYVDAKNMPQPAGPQFPRMSKFSLAELVAFQESKFKAAVYYYHRVCTVSEGIATIQALLLMAVHLETSWVISDLNFSLTSMAVRYAQDMGLHRLDSAAHLRPEEREKRARVWRTCQHFDIEVCYRLGKPPSVNLLDVSLDDLFFQGPPPDGGSDKGALEIDYDKLCYIRCYTYMRLFSAQVKYDSLKNIQDVVMVINNDMFRLAEDVRSGSRPRLYNEQGFEALVTSFTDNRYPPAHLEMLIGFHLTFFNHVMTINRVPWAVVSDVKDPSAKENSKFRKLSLDSARTILHITRTLSHISSSILLFNWLVTYPFLAVTNLLSNCLNYPDDPDVLKDLSLLIDVSLNTFGRIGARAEEEEATRLLYIRVRMADILIRVIMRVVITIVDQTCSTDILGANPGLLEHLLMVERRYPRFCKPLAKSSTVELDANLAHVTSHASPSTPAPMASSATSDNEVPLFSPSLGALEVIDFLEFGDKLGNLPHENGFGDGTNQDYLNLPNFFFDNGI
ncbi:hypothetical protein METBIDRAFT_39773 [Metschnikowia bicuspidata var. bicuspidata NRRL YB-4993]|uniref:Xylanolytic transcriptional activator regulatory domain-containing protein n=1 Tax=Metschnikowia bicuspidata var. bicuspidata NRRL YB-4993 TaxID=869754 RepID=A0A1A0HD14_9ASCO|nr:hypothetical protein METBIDRAFT_39773 [Metschnikowia bicuspidata var. bicuspidata NRRL YB-4993]OBA21833.1 hypothetical protein METBIDRAFT_39773 [Metschnikowia bicuspidata var. bicuspidata NRRL YB-4993]